MADKDNSAKAVEAPTLTVVEDAPGASRDLRRIIAIIKRTMAHWRVFAIFIALGALAGAAAVLLRKPTYSSETVVLYREGIRGSLLGQEGGTSMRTLGTRLKEMLLARPKLQEIIDEYGLYQDVKATQGEIAAVDEFRKDIQFKARALDTFWIEFRGGDPETVQAVTARLAQSLVEENARLGIDQAKVQSEFMIAAKQKSEEELRKQERELAQFLAAHPEFALDQAAQTGGGATQGASIRAAAADKAGAGGKDQALDALERQRARTQALVEGGPTLPPIEATADPALVAAQQAAQQELTSAQAELAQVQAIYTEAHPDVQSAKKRVAKAQAAAAEANAAVEASKAESLTGIDMSDPEAAKEEAKNKLMQIEAEIAARKKALSQGDEEGESSATVNRVVALETEWARLSRDVQDARDRMDDLERKAFQAQLAASSALGGYGDHIAIIDPAFLPSRPNPPGKSLIMVAAVGAFMAMALMVALLKALLDDRVYEVNDLARVAPVLAVVPRMTARRWWRRG